MRARIAIRVLLLVAVIAVAACSRSTRTPVVVYSPHGEAVLLAFKERFEAAHPDLDLQFLPLASQDVITRLRAEKGSPQCDLWWGASAVTFAQAADEGLLAPYRPGWVDAIPAEARDAQFRWIGIYETPEAIIYNSDMVAAADAPRDWDDLLDERWRGQILIRDPMSSDTMRTIFGSVILREWAKSNGPEAGYAWLRRLDANTKDYSPSWDAVLAAINRREAALTVWNMPDVKRVVDERGYKLAIVYPESGTPVVTDAIAIPAGAPHPEAARTLYEFVTTPESLAYAAEQFYRIPTRKDLDPSTLPEWVRTLEIPRMQMDWERFRAESKDWMTHWSAEIKSASARP